MNCIEQIKSSFFSFIVKQFDLSESQINRCNFELNADPDKQTFGDLNSNAAMVLAKDLSSNPRMIAQTIVDNYSHELIEKIEIAGPGFLNIFLTEKCFVDLGRQIFVQRDNFFRSNIEKQNINVEFVSANPTGPLHFGHGRNGILGDSIANVLEFLGNNITREFYINDAGSQITKLGNSLRIRYMQAIGKSIEMPEDAYHGQYLADLGKILAEESGDSLIDESSEFFEKSAQNVMLKQQKNTLQSYGISFDIWFSEKSLKIKNKLEEAMNKLIATGYTYEDDGALWFKTTEFGDDKDRVLRKSNGQYTYLAGDLPYLIDKLERGFDKLIMILGHDHHSFVIRLKSLMQALGYDPEKLQVILYQLVHIKQDGVAAKMSKRAGTIVNLHDIIDAVGKDVSRFFYLNRKADAELDFDVALALKQSNENPIFYLQYAYVRTNSIMKKAAETDTQLTTIIADDCASLTNTEKLLMKKIASLQSLLVAINHNYQTHLIAYFSYELAALFHSYYNSSKVIIEGDIKQTKNKLFIVQTVQQTLKLCFTLMGTSAPDSM